MVESYVPQLDERAAGKISSRLRDAARELAQQGVEIQWRGSFVLIDEETYLCIVAAPDLGCVVTLNDRADVAYDHMVEVVAINPSTLPANR